jgi:serine/threonine protein kinase/DNA-binding LacI/PurR family transcriptional regulator
LLSANRFIGREFRGYRVEECLYPGLIAAIFRARQSSVNRDVALKIIRIDTLMDERGEFTRRFAFEAMLIAALEHVNILPIYDYGVVQNEFAYMAMRLLRGGSLETLLQKGPMPLDRAVALFTQLASGLAFAHSQGIIHRDLKPTNVLLDDTGNAYLSDFGLAKIIELSLELTLSGNIVGTPAYMSPEQFQANRLDKRSDIYSLGVMLFEMVTGRLPFDMQDGDILSLMRQHIEIAPPHPREFNAGLPQAVEDVILTALEKEPAARYQDVWSMIVALNQAIGRHISAQSAPKPSLRFATRRLLLQVSRRAALYVMMAGLALVLALGLALSQVTGKSDSFSPVKIGGEGNAADAVPSGDEIRRAQTRLGDQGFIAYIACGLDSEFQAKRARTMADFSQQYGLNFHAYDSEMDSYQENTLIERARADGARALIICPLDPTLLNHALQELQTGSIPVVLIPASEQSYGAVMVDPDEYRIGYLIGQAAGQIITRERRGQAQVILLTHPDSPAGVRRATGMEDGLMAEAPQAQISGRFATEPTRENVRTLIGQLIQGHFPFDVILSLSDAGAIGAIEALDETHAAPNSVVIVSANAETLALSYIEEGHFLRGTVSVNMATGSRIAVDAIVKLLGGGMLPEVIHYEPGQVITRELLEGRQNPETPTPGR